MTKQTVVIATKSRSRDRVDRFIHPKLAVIRNPPLVAVVTEVTFPEQGWRRLELATR